MILPRGNLSHRELVLQAPRQWKARSGVAGSPPLRHIPVVMRRKNQSAAALHIASLIFAVSLAGCSREPTALSLVKEGNRYVGEQAKDKVVQIRSEKSIGSLTPNVWYVVYYEPDATFKATEVKFGVGKKLSVSRPLRILEMIGNNTPLDGSKLKVDSNEAIRIAAAEPLLKPLTLKATQLFLQRGEAGPEWRVQLWAARINNPTVDVEIGNVYVSADTGKVTRTDLHIESVN